MSQEDAYAFVAKAIYARYDEWEFVTAQIPKWGIEVDTQVEKFVEINKLCFLGTLRWR
jgi:hypothetical protein